MAVMFDGAYLVTPAVATALDDSQMYPSASPSGNVLVLIGESTGGKPKTPIRLRSPRHARQVLRSGPLMEAAIRAFAPSSAAGSPAVVLAVRVEPATQSAVNVLDAGGDPVLALKSTDYGQHTAALEVRLETGSRSGFRVSVRQEGAVFFRDNIGADVFTLRYTGTEATAAARVAAGNLVLEAPAGTVVQTYALRDWSTAAALVEAISGAMPDWDVTLTRGQERFKPEALDALDAADAKTAATMVTGHAKAILDFFNSSAEIHVDAALAGPAPVAPPVPCPWTRLTGGVNGNVNVVDWEDALAALHEIEAHWLVPLTDNPAVWDMVAAHCDYLSARKRERRAFVGADTGVTAEQAEMHAIALNSDRVAYVWPGVYEYDAVTRELLLKPAYQAAVNVAAGFASLNPGTTMSRKPISVAGAEVLLREPTDTDTLIEHGVLPLVQSDQGVIVSQAVSTWQMDERYNRREVSVGAAVDYVIRSVRKALQPLLGDRASPEVLPRARTRLESTLADLAVAPPIGPGVLVGDLARPAWKNITVDLENDILRVSFECQPVIPINYVLIGVTVSPYRGTVTA